MKSIKLISYFLFFLLMRNSSLNAQNALTFGTSELGVRAVINNDGSIQTLTFGNSADEQKVNFRNDDWRGPGFGKEVILSQDLNNPFSFKGEINGIVYSISYSAFKNNLRIIAEAIFRNQNSIYNLNKRSN